VICIVYQAVYFVLAACFCLGLG